MKQVIVLALMAAAALAEGPALTVGVDYAVETLSEGERAVAIFHVTNVSSTGVILLAIEPEDGIAVLGAQVSRPIEALRVDQDADRRTMEVEFGEFEQRAPRCFPDVLVPALLAPGQERSHELVFKAPAGHTYAIHFRVSYLPAERAVAERRLYVPEAEAKMGADPMTYHLAESLEGVSEEAFDNGGRDLFVHHEDEVLLRIDGLEAPELVHAAIAVEVKPREFSFAAATKEVGVVPDAATWLESRSLWALAGSGKTWLVGEGTRIELTGDYVQFLTEIELSGEETKYLAAPGDDALAEFLRAGGTEEAQQRNGVPAFVVAVRDLPEVLQKAEELGFEVTRNGWKKRQ